MNKLPASSSIGWLNSALGPGSRLFRTSRSEQRKRGADHTGPDCRINVGENRLQTR